MKTRDGIEIVVGMATYQMDGTLVVVDRLLSPSPWNGKWFADAYSETYMGDHVYSTKLAAARDYVNSRRRDVTEAEAELMAAIAALEALEAAQCPGE